MQYKINTKAFHEAFKEPSTAFYKNWTCPIHGPRDICSHYTESFEKFKSEFMKKFIEPYTPQSLKPVGIHIAKKLVAPEGYEYGWKTYVNNSFKELEADDWFPVGYLSPHLNIPRDSSGLYIDGDAVLCMRIKHACKTWDSVSGTIADRAANNGVEGNHKTADIGEIYPLAQVVPEGCPTPDGTADIERDIANNFETLIDDTHYSMGNRHYKMPAEQNDLGHSPALEKAIVEKAKKHIVPGWEDNEANRIARKAVENMNRLEKLGLSKQDETVDPREVLLRIFGEPKKVTVTEDGEALEINAFYPDGVVEDKIYETVTADPVPDKNKDEKERLKKVQRLQGSELDEYIKLKGIDQVYDEYVARRFYTHEFKEEDMIHPNEIEQMCKEKGLDYDNLSGDNCEMICTEIMGKRKLDKLYSSIHDEPVPVESIPESPGERYIKYLKAINSKTREGFSFDEAYEIVGQDYPEFSDSCDESADAKGYTYVRCKELKPKAYTYSGYDAEVWAPIMENMESNIAKANALEKVKESFPIDALTLIMGYHFGKHTADEMDDKRIDFVEKYRSLITDMGYSRF